MDKHEQDLLAQLAAQIAAGMIASGTNAENENSRRTLVKTSLDVARAILESARGGESKP